MVGNEEEGFPRRVALPLSPRLSLLFGPLSGHGLAYKSCSFHARNGLQNLVSSPPRLIGYNFAFRR